MTFWVISMFIGTAARFFLFHTGWNSNLENRVELVTPFSSLERRSFPSSPSLQKEKKKKKKKSEGGSVLRKEWKQSV